MKLIEVTEKRVRVDESLECPECHERFIPTHGRGKH
jgi:hypothetical protein